MKTSRLNYTLNFEDAVAKLRPFVTTLKETNQPGYEHTVTGFYKGKPVFQISKDKIHILRWDSTEYFHTDTKSIDKAITIINESILFLKSFIAKKRIEQANEDF